MRQKRDGQDARGRIWRSPTLRGITISGRCVQTTGDLRPPQLGAGLKIPQLECSIDGPREGVVSICRDGYCGKRAIYCDDALLGTGAGEVAVPCWCENKEVMTCLPNGSEKPLDSWAILLDEAA